METETTPFSAVTDFIGSQARLGKYNGATARNLLAACSLIAKRIQPGKDSLRYVADHLDDLLQQHANLNKGVGNGALVAYKSRVSRAISDYRRHRADPEWVPTTRARAPRRNAASTPKPGMTGEAASASGAAEEQLRNASELLHRLPLRPDFDVEIRLPRDFNRRELEMVTTWVGALALAPAPEQSR
jgi:hypothetical protein